MLPLSSTFYNIYNKNYDIKMFIKKVVIMNKVFFHQVMGVMNLVAIF
jgi:hypothetical protein